MITYGKKKITPLQTGSKDSAKIWDSVMSKLKSKLPPPQEPTDKLPPPQEPTDTPKASKTIAVQDAAMNDGRNVREMRARRNDESAHPKPKSKPPLNHTTGKRSRKTSEPTAANAAEKKFKYLHTPAEVNLPILSDALHEEFIQVLEAPNLDLGVEPESPCIDQEIPMIDSLNNEKGTTEAMEDSQPSQPSSVFDMIFESPPKKEKTKRVGRMTKMASSPNETAAAGTTDGVPKPVSRKIIPQYSLQQALAGQSDHNEFGSPARKAPLQLVSDADSPSKKELLLISRPTSTITYSRLDPQVFMATIKEDEKVEEFTDLTPGPSNPALEDLMESLEADTTVQQIDEGLESSDDEKPKTQGFHQLRAAGNSKRVLDEISYLFEGVFSKTLSVQRSSCFDLFKKVQQDHIVKVMRMHGKVKEVYEGLKNSNDPIVLTALSFIICVLGRDLKNIESIVNQDFLNWTMNRLENTVQDDILIKLPKKKFDKVLVTEFIESLKKSDCFQEPLSTSFPLLQLIDNLIKTHAATLYFDGIQASDKLLEYLISTSVNEDHRPSGIENAKCSLTLIQEFTGFSSTEKQLKLFDESFTNHLWTQLANSFDGIKRNEDEYPFEIATEYIEKILLVLVNFYGPKKQSSFRISKDCVDNLMNYLVLTQDDKKGKDEQHDCWFDIQAVILVLLVNIVLGIPTLASTVHDFDYSGKNGIELLVDMFNSYFKNWVETSSDQIKIRCTYVATLLGHVIILDEQTLKSKSISKLDNFENVLLILRDYHQELCIIMEQGFGKQDDTVRSLDQLIHSLQAINSQSSI